MPGFNLSLGDFQFPKKRVENENLDYDCIKGNKYVARKHTLNKFENDKLFIERDNYLLIIEGVILNKNKFIKDDSNWEDAVLNLYKMRGNTFFKDFRGSFSGALYDKNEGKWVIFTDHIGSKHIYYSKQGKALYISSEITDLYALLKNNNVSYSLDRQAGYMLLSYGYMLDDYTLCNEIKKLTAGSFIVYKDGEISINTYYSLPVEYEGGISEREAIERVDTLFRNAIQLQFEKDREYGYQHLVALSGGLDSRMTSWVAHDMGYTDQLNFTFSQSGYLDETIARDIATDLKHKWIFKALDNGLFLKDLDEINKISGGQALYYGLAHGHSMRRYINFRNLGIVHSGQLGDVILGSYIKAKRKKYYYNGQGVHSRKLLHKIDKIIECVNANDLEDFMLRQRGFNGINTGLLATQKYTETLSPFYDVDLFNFSLKLPLKLRLNHSLYKKWISNYYPQAADYIWESTKAKLTDSHIQLLGKEVSLKQLPEKILRKLRLRKPATETSNHMNPLDYWYKNNPDIKEFQDQYFEQNVDRLNGYLELKQDCTDLYKTGNATEKNQVLTLLSAMKLFF